MKSGLVFVHGVEYSLQGQVGERDTAKRVLSGISRVLGPLPG